MTNPEQPQLEDRLAALEELVNELVGLPAELKKLKGEMGEDYVSLSEAGGGAPTGPAGGALAGEYPNPEIAANAIVESKIAANAVTGTKIKAEAVTEPKLAKAVTEKLNPTAWENLALGAKVEAGGLQVPGVRGEDGLSMGRLRGRPQVKAAEELKAGETLATITSAEKRPAATIEISVNTSAGAAVKLIIANTGVITCSANLAAAVSLPLDSETYNIT